MISFKIERYLLVAVLSIPIFMEFGCAGTIFSMKMQRVHEGMSQGALKERLGNPTEIEPVGEYVFYEYRIDTLENYYFIFYKGRLLKWEKGWSIADKINIRRAEYEKLMKQYVGSHIDTFVNKFGYPQNTIQAPNGNTVYVFSKSAQIPMGGTFFVNTLNTKFGAFTSGNVSPSKSIPFYCNTFVEIGSDKRIVNIRLEGNGCI